MEIAIGIIAAIFGLLAGAMAVALFFKKRGPTDEDLRSQFQALSQDALALASDRFLRLAEERLSRQSQAGEKDLDTKKELIDQQLGAMNRQLEGVSTMVRTYERDREAKFAELNTQIKTMGERAASLTESTSTLREALSNSRVRGQWGERMAEDILRALGLIEGINYHKQKAIRTPGEGPGARPDFVFTLPSELKINMDVKFPLDNYLKFLEEDSEAEREQHRAAFVRDVRAKIREVSTREYIDPEQGTVDYVLMFIPNESIYSFIHESDAGFLDHALGHKVVCCSPFTLFAVLSVVRQAADNFALQQDSEKIVSLFGRFYAEWQKFGCSLDVMGRRLVSVQNEYANLTGPRKRMLERPLRQIDELRQRKELPVALAEEFSEPESVLDFLSGSYGDSANEEEAGVGGE